MFITIDTMKVPTITNEGHSYELTAIADEDRLIRMYFDPVFRMGILKKTPMRLSINY